MEIFPLSPDELSRAYKLEFEGELSNLVSKLEEYGYVQRELTDRGKLFRMNLLTR